ncbi:hypothetical protein C8J57DRAFT_206150 [Mycena rebaudengoi]|nr:hypothetical protein C8J57DRAFT_206150 [Mycena rebaudengoi]
MLLKPRSDQWKPSMNWVGYDMTEVFAPLFLGTVVSLVLSGITIMQAYIYFPTNDRGFLQIIAVLMIVFDLISTGLIAQGLYYYIVPNFRSLLPLGNLNPSLAAECFMSVFIVFVSHLFFAFQIYSVIGRGPNKYGVPGAVAFFGAVSLVCSSPSLRHYHVPGEPQHPHQQELQVCCLCRNRKGRRGCCGYHRDCCLLLLYQRVQGVWTRI